MLIRAATVEDLGSIQKLYWELDGDAIQYQPSLFVRTARPGEFMKEIITGEKSDILVMEHDNGIIGFSLLQEKETPPISCLKEKKYVYILDFVITEASRNQGFGSLLLEASKAWGKQRGLDFLRLSVFEDNEKGQAFYRRNGLKATMRTMECEL